MSAYVVDRAHIDALVRVAVEGPRHAISPSTAWYGAHDPDTHERLSADDADRIGVELWSENVRSVAYRYPNDGNGERPGPCGFVDEDAWGYTFERSRARRLDAVEAMVALLGLDYQSCEHPEWEASWSSRFIGALLRQLVHYLPGADEVSWKITPEVRA